MLEIFKKLKELIKSHNRVILMTHSTPDLDGLGSSIVFSEILKKFDKENYIVAPKKMVNKSLNNTVSYLNKSGLVIPFKYEKSIDVNNALLIIFDVREPKLVECPELLEQISDIVVIDHHSKGLTSIENTVLLFIDDTKSSTIEMIVEFLQYLNIKLDKKFYTLMLTALCVDTNNFNLKTSPRTFEIASYILQNGADLNLKQEFLKENKRDVLNRYFYIKNAVKLESGVYICIIDDKICTKEEVALLADEMLKFEDVNLSLAVGKKSDNEVVVSARSIGNIDVSMMMKKLGGGGHFGAAAALIKSSNIDDVIEDLKLIVRGENSANNIA